MNQGFNNSYYSKKNINRKGDGNCSINIIFANQVNVDKIINNENFIIQNNLIFCNNQKRFYDEKNDYFKNNNSENFDEEQNQYKFFFKFVKNLSSPLEKLLCTTKGILKIQKKLDKLGNEFKIFLVDYLNKRGLPIIMKNLYGNYFFQHLIKDGDKVLISHILHYISNDFVNISKDCSGTFSIQALLDKINLHQEQKTILKFIEGHELEMAYDKNATHVLRKIILIISDVLRININNIILKNFLNLCLDSYGICILKNYINTNTIVKEREILIKLIYYYFVQIAENPFGNYCVQLILEKWKDNDLSLITQKIFETYELLSLKRFSSNVIEKAIEVFDEKNQTLLIKKICFDKKLIFDLINNKFGKFVLEKALQYMNDELKNEFYIFMNNKLINNSKEAKKIKRLLIKVNDKMNNFNNSPYINFCFNNYDYNNKNSLDNINYSHNEI